MRKRSFSLKKSLAVLSIVVFLTALGGSPLWAEDDTNFNSFSILVVDTNGDPISNLELTLMKIADGNDGISSHMATSNSEGLLTFTDVPDGYYTLSAIYNGYEYSVILMVGPDVQDDTIYLQLQDNTEVDTDTGADTNSDTDTNTNTDSDTDTDSNSDTDTNTDSDTDTDTESNSDTDTNKDTSRDTDSDTSSKAKLTFTVVKEQKTIPKVPIAGV